MLDEVLGERCLEIRGAGEQHVALIGEVPNERAVFTSTRAAISPTVVSSNPYSLKRSTAAP